MKTLIFIFLVAISLNSCVRKEISEKHYFIYSNEVEIEKQIEKSSGEVFVYYNYHKNTPTNSILIYNIPFRYHYIYHPNYYYFYPPHRIYHRPHYFHYYDSPRRQYKNQQPRYIGNENKRGSKSTTIRKQGPTRKGGDRIKTSPRSQERPQTPNVTPRRIEQRTTPTKPSNNRGSSSSPRSSRSGRR